MGYISCWIDAHSWVSLHLWDRSSWLFNTIIYAYRTTTTTTNSRTGYKMAVLVMYHNFSCQ